ncbi:MAG: arsenite methyltransferase [Candidatus Thermoplasmatota archaeon]|nr:arsenite methyltransferase [Candidatus Thermoplasmatota archaeon]
MKRNRTEKPKSGKASGSPSHASEEEIRRAVRNRYAKLAQSGQSCCDGNASCSCGSIYPQATISTLPDDAIAVSAGCGNPTAIASLRPGMTVVDFGSGGGIDAFLAAKKVGPEGRVYGIDATHEMVLRARRTANESGFENVEFRLGEIEHVPLDAEVADVVISNCVINLSPDKKQVFREAFRILKPGGRIAVSDIVLLNELPDEIRKDLAAWSGCVSGAVSEEEYLGAIEGAGFEKVKVEDRFVYRHEQLSGYLKETDLSEDPRLKGVDLSQLVASYRITAMKPAGRKT